MIGEECAEDRCAERTGRASHPAKLADAFPPGSGGPGSCSFGCVPRIVDGTAVASRDPELEPLAPIGRRATPSSRCDTPRLSGTWQMETGGASHQPVNDGPLRPGPGVHIAG